MDQQKLRTLVFEKTGIKVDTHDPIFALVALNEAVLAESVGIHVAAMDDATRRLATHIKHLQENGGGSARHSPEMPAASSSDESAQPRGPWLSMVTGAAIALAGAALALGAQALSAKHAAPAAPAVKALFSPEQAAMLRNAEKMSKAIQNLDPETRARLQAEMQKQ